MKEGIILFLIYKILNKTIILLVLLAFMVWNSGNTHAFTAADADAAINKFNDAFYTGSGSNRYYKNDTTGGGPDFWKSAEMIEMVEDAYERSGNSVYRGMINELYNGFCYYFSTNWTGNIYNDDIMWMVLACIRAYQITGNTTYLNQAKTHFDQVYSRAYDTALGGGLWWTTAKTTKNTCINCPAVIAACRLYQILGDSSYLSKAQSLYAWQLSRLWDNATGSVWDSINSSGSINKVNFTYTQGTFIGASNLLYQITGVQSYYDNAKKALDYTRNHMTTNNILQSENGSDLSGFKGIFCRYALKFVKENGLVSTYQAWFQLNANTAWSHKDSRGLMDQNWAVQTGSGVLQSWSCSSAVVLMQVCPPDTGVTPTPTPVITRTPTPVPSINGVVFYQDADFKGKAVMLSAGNYTLAQLQGAGISDNSVSSLRVPAGWIVEIYQNNNFGGTKWTFTADTSYVGSACNDQMSSVKIIAPQVTFYQHADYAGTAVSLSKGNYTLAQLQAAGIPNDWVSSLRIPAGWTVEIYQNDNFGGTKWTFTADISYVGAAANDQMTSCKIF